MARPQSSAVAHASIATIAGGCLAIGRVGLRILQLHLQLVYEPLLAFRACATECATQLFDLQPQPRDQRMRGDEIGRERIERVRHVARES